MKTCPCCKSLTFDDMDVCYVCMHPFVKDGDPAASNPSCSWEECQGGSSSAKPLSMLGDVCDETSDDSLEDFPGLEHAEIDDGLHSDTAADASSGAVAFGTSVEIVDLDGPGDGTSDGEPSGHVSGSCVDASEDKLASAARWRIDVALEGFPEFSMEIGSGSARVTFGRALGNRVIIPDLHVSRRHAEIYESEGRLWITDCESTNMTFLNGFPVLGTREVRDGSRIDIGPARISVTACSG